LSLRSLICLALTASLACSRLPSYARPEGALVEPGSVDDSDLIPYRKLTRADFKGKRPSGEAAEHVDAMGAQTYAIVRPNSSLRIELVGTPKSNGKLEYSGKVSDLLHFRAEMDRRKSWWNPNLKEVPEAYVLEHEQIHFAIVEVKARELNAKAPELTARMHATGDSEEQVKSRIVKKLDAVIEDALGELLAENRRFDEDTSGRYAPEKQNEWYRRVTAELGKH
jgi:hypothetical protein